MPLFRGNCRSQIQVWGRTLVRLHLLFSQSGVLPCSHICVCLFLDPHSGGVPLVSLQSTKKALPASFALHKSALVRGWHGLGRRRQRRRGRCGRLLGRSSRGSESSAEGRRAQAPFREAWRNLQTPNWRMVLRGS